MKLKILFLLSLFFTQQVFSAPPDNSLEYQDLDYLEKTENKPQKDTQIPSPNYVPKSDSEQITEIIDENYGMMIGSHSTANDSSRLSFIYGINSSLTKAAELSQLEFNYAKKWGYTWFDFSYSQFKARTYRLTNAFSTTENKDEDTFSLNNFGAGLTYRTSLIQNFLDGAYFETTTARLVYATGTNTVDEKNYVGWGLQTDFGVHKRLSANFHLGLKGSYNFRVLRKEQEFDTESGNSRGITLSWLSFAGDLSFYF